MGSVEDKTSDEREIEPAELEKQTNKKIKRMLLEKLNWH